MLLNMLSNIYEEQGIKSKFYVIYYDKLSTIDLYYEQNWGFTDNNFQIYS